MRWANLHALWALAAAPLVVWLFLRASRARVKAMESLGDAKLLEKMTPSLSRRRRSIKTALVVVAIALAAVAMARPQVGTELREVRSSGRDVIFALDVSNSMLAQDVAPSRIGAAKGEIYNLIDEMKGDRIGLVVFSGVPFLQCPLTMDSSAFRLLLDIVNAGMMPTQGTDIASAIEESLAAFQFEESRERVIVLLTDGEDHFGKAIEASKKAAENHVAIYTIGLGKPGEGAPIPIKREDGSVEYKRDSEGKTIMTVLDEDALQKIASETGGKYFYGGETLDLKKIYGEIAKKEGKSRAEDRFYTHYEDRYQWLLIPALILLLIEASMSERIKYTNGKKLKTAAIVALLPLLMAFGGPVVENVRRGNQFFKEGKFPEALSAYTEAQRNAPDDPRLHYNIGAALYAQGKYAEARESFKKAMVGQGNDFASRSWYNIGNSFAREGEAKNDIAALQNAASAYEKALELNPSDEDSKYNLEVVRKLIEMKKKEQQQQQQQQQQQNQQNQESQQATQEQKLNEQNQSTEERQMRQERQSTSERQLNEQPQATSERQMNEANQSTAEQQPGENLQPGEISREDAERILRALEDRERDNLNERMQQTPSGQQRVLKDW